MGAAVSAFEVDRRLLLLAPLFTVLVVGGGAVAVATMWLARRHLLGRQLEHALDLLEAAYILAVLVAFVTTLVVAGLTR